MADRSVSIALVANVAGFVSGMKVSEQAVRSLGNEISKSAKKQQALRELGNAAGAMGAVAAIGVVAVVKAAASFESAMSRVAATGDDAKNNLDALHDAAIAAGAATKFSATEAADGITELLKAGVSAKDVLSGGLTGALNLAAAGEIGCRGRREHHGDRDVAVLASPARRPHIADLLAAAAGKAQGEVPTWPSRSSTSARSPTRWASRSRRPRARSRSSPTRASSPTRRARRCGGC
jgi:hypothetical protein